MTFCCSMLSYVAAHIIRNTELSQQLKKTYMGARVQADDTSHGTYYLDILPLSETKKIIGFIGLLSSRSNRPFCAAP